MSMLEVRDIDVYYGEVQTLRGVSFSVKESEAVGLVGANGAGKTTTLKAVTGLLPLRSGTVTFLGERIDNLPAHRIVDMGIAHVPEGRRLFPHMTVLENLEVGSYLPRAKKLRKQTLEFVLELFPVLKERKDQFAGTLSGGEQQMLTIGRGLMSRPRLLMMDEISLGLAPVLVRRIFDMIKEIQKEGISLFMVEQNVQLCLENSDRGYVLENGSIVMEGSGKDLLEDDQLREAYLGL
ncbi:MAG: ABC transporter ATP-binding protein [Actinobacteria bacterium]|nr:ABC transporter ATP-binding protein [Actinomycetota bacterium]